MGADPLEAQHRYDEWVEEFKRKNTPKPAPRVETPEKTVAEVLVAYYRHAMTEYAHNKATRHRIYQAMQAVKEPELELADLPVSQFRGPQLKKVREHLVKNRKHRQAEDGRALSRTYINYLVACVQRAWKWGLSEDLVPHDSAESVAAVTPLAKGKGGREPKRVLPPAAGWEDTLAELTPVLSAMVQVQQLCGMRPQDVCRLCRGEVSTSPAEKVEITGTGRHVAAFVEDGHLIWLYAPGEHKTSWQGKPRVVAIGPRAQRLLAPLLEGLQGDDYVFSPARSLQQRGRGNRFKRQGYSRCYATRQYAQLVERAIERLNRRRVEAGCCPEEMCPEWSPNQLRHLAGTVVGDELDREHARAMLGQSSTDVIDTYMEQQVRKAARAASRCG
jgi:integrase